MNILLRGEFYKFSRSKKNMLVFLLTLVFLGGFTLFTIYREQQYIEQRYEELKIDRQIAESQLKLHYFRSKEENSQEILGEVAFWTKEESLTSSLAAHYRFHEDDMITKIMRWEIDRSQNLIIGYQKGYIESYPFSVEERITQMQHTIDTNKYFLDQDKTPMRTPYSLSGLNFLYLLLQDIFPLIFLFIVFLYSIDIYTTDLENGSYKFVYSLPYHRGEIFTAKLLMILLGSTLGIILAIVIFLVGISMKCGLGDMQYPIIVFLKKVQEGSNWYVMNTQMNMMKILGYNVAMFLSLLVFINMFILWVSVITDSASLVVSVIIGIFLLSYSIVSFNGFPVIRDWMIITFYPIVNQTVELGIQAVTNKVIYVWSITSLLLGHGFWHITQKNFVGGKE